MMFHLHGDHMRYKILTNDFQNWCWTNCKIKQNMWLQMQANAKQAGTKLQKKNYTKP